NLLEEIRILSDLERDGKLLDVLLVGQPELDMPLQTPELRQLSQRIAVRVDLDPFGREDVASYINHRLTVAGNGKIAFEDAAIDYICAGSAGIPRVINLLCDKALTKAAAAEAAGVEAAHVVEAAAELRISLG